MRRRFAGLAWVMAAIGALTIAMNGPGPAGAAESWSGKGPMATARAGHVAIALANGKVLVAGGRSDSGFVDTAELFDPAANRWTAAGTPRFGNLPAATRLARNRVLVTGGGHQRGACPSADCVDNKAAIFDGATNRFTAAASMAERRLGHTATQLADGTVLVAGGDADGVGVNTSAERYDPKTDAWWAAGSMAQPRTLHTATLLGTGNVLVAGGSTTNATTGTATAELYDPAEDSWTSAQAMATARTAAAATLLPNGHVLVSGGADTAGQAVATTELYDPIVSAWTAGPALAAARAFHTATSLPDGRVVVAGGTTQASLSGKPLASAEIYDWKTNTFTAAPAMSATRAQFATATLPDGSVLVTGGVPMTAVSEQFGTTGSRAPGGVRLVDESTTSSSSSSSTSSTSSSSTSSTVAQGAAATVSTALTTLSICQSVTSKALAEVDAKLALTRTLMVALAPADVIAPVLAQLTDVRAQVASQLDLACAPFRT